MPTLPLRFRQHIRSPFLNRKIAQRLHTVSLHMQVWEECIAASVECGGGKNAAESATTAAADSLLSVFLSM
jgi:hypothetical protein